MEKPLQGLTLIGPSPFAKRIRPPDKRGTGLGIRRERAFDATPLYLNNPWERWMRERQSSIVSYLETATAHFRELKELSYHSLSLKRGDVVLDVGCGLGQDVRDLTGFVGSNGRVIGIDYSPAMIAEARNRSDGAILPLLIGEAQNLSFSTDTFDACRADRLFQHVADPRAVLAEMARVTKPAGLVQVIDRDWGMVAVDSDNQQLTRQILGAMFERVRNGSIGRMLPVLFKDAGLQLVRLTAPLTMVREFRLANALLDLTDLAAFASGKGYVNADDATAWLQELEARSISGRFFAAWTMFMVTGQKVSHPDLDSGLARREK